MKEVPDFLLHTSFGREGRTSRWELQRNKGQSLWKEIPPIKDYVPVCLFSAGTDLVWMSLSCQARLGVPVLCLPCVSTGRLKRQHANYQPSLQTLRVKAPLLRLMRLEGCCFRGEIGTPFYVSYQLPVAFTLRKAGVRFWRLFWALSCLFSFSLFPATSSSGRGISKREETKRESPEKNLRTLPPFFFHDCCFCGKVVQKVESGC